MPEADLAGVIRESGLVTDGEGGVVMVSGGADSVALLTGLVELLGPERLVALHVNYGLRPEADAEESLVHRLCARLEVTCETHRAGSPAGNIQAWARDVRHQQAERIRAERGLDWIAVGHNRSDQAETLLYRLAVSPGVRSLLAMPPRSGHLVRPLLALDRHQIRELIDDRVEYAEDASNEDPAYARNRIRSEVIPQLEQINPAAELNIARTRRELEEDDAALSILAVGALIDEWDPSSGSIPGLAIAGEDPAVGRRMIRCLAEDALDRPVTVTSATLAEVLRLCSGGEGGSLDLGGGATLLIEAGQVSVVSGPADETPIDSVPVNTGTGVTRFGAWEIESSQATETEARQGFGNPWVAWLDLDGLAPLLRGWRDGDRIEPLGMPGSKKLQDVFTDALIPASRRRSWPILQVGETVIWVPGLVRSRHLLIGGPNKEVLRLHARPPFSH